MLSLGRKRWADLRRGLFPSLEIFRSTVTKTINFNEKAEEKYGAVVTLSLTETLPSVFHMVLEPSTTLPSINWDSRSTAHQGKHAGDQGTCLNLRIRHLQSKKEHSGTDTVITDVTNWQGEMLFIPTTEACQRLR